MFLEEQRISCVVVAIMLPDHIFTIPFLIRTTCANMMDFEIGHTLAME